jgi:hypothetical protein
MLTDDKPQAKSEPEEKVVTIFVTPAGYAKAEKEFAQLEQVAGCEVALGTGEDWINVYTTNTKVIVRVVDFLGKSNVVEISEG